MFTWQRLEDTLQLPAFIRALNQRMIALSVLLKGMRKEGTTVVFEGAAHLHGGVILHEIAAPDAPPEDHLILFARDNGAGKTQLCARFHTGAVQVLSTEP